MPTRTVLSEEEMARELSAKKKNRLYTSSEKSEAISLEVSRIAEAIADKSKYGKRVYWEDFEHIKAQTLEYLNACEQTGSLPTMQGLCALGFGCTTNAMYEFMKNHPNSETTGFLQQLKEAFADFLINTASKNETNPIITIFTLKNNHQFTDKFDVSQLPVADNKPKTAALPCEDLLEAMNDEYLPIDESWLK